MLSSISLFRPAIINNKQTKFEHKNYYPNLAPLKQDTICFRGMSQASEYKTVFQYLAADILSKQKKYGVDGSLLSANNISKGIDNLFKNDGVYTPYTLSNAGKIRWKAYVPQDVREFSVNKINDARKSRLDHWKEFLENPENDEKAKEYPKLVSNISKRKPLRFVIWHAVTSELKENNRHIPVPFNAKALAQTVEDFEAIPAISRKVRCSSPSFLEMYTHRLRDNLLEEKGLSNNNAVWVKIPSVKHDPKNKEKNISELETLSCRNWCTRSSVDKAEAALEEGDFYIYLERDKKNNLWQPLIGMASYKNKIDQIQGIENNNVIPINQLENVKSFIQKEGLKCQSGIIDEGPKAYQQILICEKMAEYRPDFEKSFEKAVKDEDAYTVFRYLDKSVNHLDNDKLEIGTYKPSYLANANSGITIPYSMIGIDEDVLLHNVQKINGDLVLYNKNPLYNSSIKQFPPNLEKVTGKIICSKEQFEKFGDDMKRVVKYNSDIAVH